MQRKWVSAVLGAALAGSFATSGVVAAPPWQALVPFRRVEADPNKAYLLSDDDGPWLIMCRAFAGETAEQDAHALVLELRQRYKLKAYVHQKEYDFTQKETGKGFDMYGSPKVMIPANPTQFLEVAVLVGDFDGPDDPKVDDTLEAIKKARPACLDVKAGKGQSQRYWGLRVVTRSKSNKTDGKGPMRMAFLTRNPRLPVEYFAPKGIDPLVKSMNRGLKHSLLKNPGAYSVRVATFRGDTTTTLRGKDYEKASREELTASKLLEGEKKAATLVQALRDAGFEAYEFHDRHESIVTVGSFDSVGEPRPDGKIEINPAVLATINRFKAPEQAANPANAGAQKFAGISLDVQPTPVAVPKESVGAAYASGARD